MIDLVNHLLLGFSTALLPINLMYCLVGAILGTLIGVLPGIGPAATIAMLLPLTFNAPPISSMIMLAGIYYGAQYGGSTTSILLNIPGEASSVVTCLDGYQMARQGRAGVALSVSALGSFAGGCVATVMITLFSPPLAEFALRFGPAEYFSLMLLGLVGAAILAHGSPMKAIAMIVLGILLGLVGTDVSSGLPRFSFGIRQLSDGIGFVVVAMGVLGFAEIISNLELKEKRDVFKGRRKGLLPSRADLNASWKPALRGSVLGSLIGILPGGSATLASFASYAVEKRVAQDRSRFGQGAIEGVAGPETANNAASQTSFIPMLTLGIPSNAVMALMLGAMMIQGISPGPLVMTEHSRLFWSIIASMWVGNLMLLALNLPLIGIWIRMLTIPYRLLFPSIAVFIAIGAYSLNSDSFDVVLAVLFGLLGCIFHKLGCEPAPLLLGFILGPIMEEHLRRAMRLSRGDPTVFITQPLSLAMLIIAAFLLVLMIAPGIQHKREEVFKE
jgi:putative tricarboxylic transport membrane protein